MKGLQGQRVEAYNMPPDAKSAALCYSGVFQQWGSDVDESGAYSVAIVLCDDGIIKMPFPPNIRFIEEDQKTGGIVQEQRDGYKLILDTLFLDLPRSKDDPSAIAGFVEIAWVAALKLNALK